MKLARIAGLSAFTLVAAIGLGCSHDADHGTTGGMSSGMHGGDQPVEGNPRATTGPSVGYPQSDTNGYHPLTDDTRTSNGNSQYHPAPVGTVQPR